MEIKAGRELFISSHLRSEVSRLVLGSPSAVIPAQKVNRTDRMARRLLYCALWMVPKAELVLAPVL